MDTKLFRQVTDAALALAVVALGYVEYPLFPEAGWLAAAAAVAIGVIARVEKRVRLLSIPDANKLGAAVGLGWAIWAGVRIAREAARPEFTGLGWVQFLVALFGPLLMVAIPAMLVRREKTASDYWQIFAAGLGAAVLAGAMTDDPAAVALLAAGGWFGVWGLRLFAAGRAVGAVPAAGEPAAVPAGAGPGWGAGPALIWAGAAVAAAVLLYFVTPPSAFARFEFVKQRVEVGYAADQMIDLNRTGNLRSNPEVAFEVRAEEDDGTPKTDLGPEQRWRGSVLTAYDEGTWRRDQQVLPPTVARKARMVPAGAWTPPDLGPGRFRLAFRVPAKHRAEFLAEPVAWAADQPVPVADVTPAGPAPWFVQADGSFTRIAASRQRAADLEYVQLTLPADDPDLGPGFLLEAAQRPDQAYTKVTVERVRGYADEVLAAAVRSGRLPAAAARPEEVTRRPAEVWHEAVGRELARHLAAAPDLRYTTDLRRENKAVDPVIDFLYHSKVGHCERFATALVLLLRSQGIPSALVLGFKGCDRGDADGDYLVRQSHAHAWAEALISRPGPGGRGRVWHWLSLDPSPAADADADAGGADDGWLARSRAALQRLLAEYPAERREQAVRDAADWATRPAVWAGAAGVALAGLGVWRLRRRARRRADPGGPAGDWADGLTAALAAHGYAREPRETPREFAARVGDDLGRAEPTVAVAGFPAEWVEWYYGERFGGRPTPPPERAEFARRLDAFAASLRSRP